MRRPFINKIWWFFAYKGIYQLNWWMKAKLGNRSMSDKEMWRRLFR